MCDEELTIRSMSEKDLERVLDIQTRAYDPSFHEGGEVFSERLDLFPVGCWIAYLGECAVAYLFSHPWLQNLIVELDSSLGVLPDAPDCLYIHDLSVDPKFKGRGIGSKMFAKAKELAVELQFSKLVLISVQDSAGFWEKLGFEPVGGLSDEMEEKLKSYGADACMMIAII